MYSERDMKEFFQNVVDQVATLSTQASKVEGLEQRILNMSDRLRDLEDKNAELQHQVEAANNTIRIVQQELDNARQDLSNERAVIHSMRETAVARDNKVQELEQNNQVEREAHRVTLSERDDARRHVDELGESLHRTTQQVNDISTERDSWRDRAYKAEAEVNDLKSKLDKVNAVLNPLRAISGDVQAVG